MIELIEIFKSYSEHTIFKNLSLKINAGTIVTIIGPSGHGKSTLLNMIAGLEKPTAGRINISDKNMGYILQENVMLPWRTLKENVRLSLEVQKQLNDKNSKIASDYIHRLGLHGFEDHYPETLSGGMKQRASLIRCLITKPNILLMDEPFTNLDFEIKLHIQKEILAYQYRTNATIIMVTHDIEDAIALSDEVIVLTGKPAVIKSKISIDLGLTEKDPVLARKSEMFPNYFAKIWDELKYLNS